MATRSACRRRILGADRQGQEYHRIYQEEHQDVAEQGTLHGRRVEELREQRSSIEVGRRADQMVQESVARSAAPIRGE
jgi:hypothetical protein